MKTNKPKTTQELIDQLQAWNKRYYERYAKKEIKPIKQREFITLETQKCEPNEKVSYNYIMGIFALPNLEDLSFIAIYDHVEHLSGLDRRYAYKKVVFNHDALNCN